MVYLLLTEDLSIGRSRVCQRFFSRRPRSGPGQSSSKLTAHYQLVHRDSDVVTTGATVTAATRALLSAGAREVWVVSLARTL